jgi:hypothetical protein
MSMNFIFRRDICLLLADAESGFQGDRQAINPLQENAESSAVKFRRVLILSRMIEDGAMVSCTIAVFGMISSTVRVTRLDEKFGRISKTSARHAKTFEKTASSCRKIVTS